MSSNEDNKNTTTEEKLEQSVKETLDKVTGDSKEGQPSLVDTALGKIGETTEGITKMAGEVVDVAKTKLSEAQGALHDVWDGASGKVGEAYEGSKNAVGGAIEGSKRTVGGVYDTTVGKLGEVKGGIGQMAGQAVDGTKQKAGEARDMVGGFVDNLQGGGVKTDEGASTTPENMSTKNPKN